MSGATPPHLLLSQRSAIIVGLALTVSLVVGALTFWSVDSLAAAVLSGLMAFGATCLGLHGVLE